MTTNTRQERLLERLQEDERLRGDLEDDAATALLNWASSKVSAATDDAQRADGEVEAEVQMIRSAARTAAQAGDSDAAQVVAQAEAAWTLARGPSAPLAAAPHQLPASLVEAALPRAVASAAPAGKQAQAQAAPAAPLAASDSATPGVGIAPQPRGVAATAHAPATPSAPPVAQANAAPARRKHHPAAQRLRKVRRSWAQRLGDWIEGADDKR